MKNEPLKGIFVQLPAREGSKRVFKKNLRYLADKPMYQYALEAAINVNTVDQVVANSDSKELLELAKSLGATPYLRPKHLADDNSTGDDFTLDFIQKFRPETLVLVNPACPLIDSIDIEHALQAFQANTEADTLITANVTQMPTFLEDKPVNISLDEPMQPTQNNQKVITLNWAIAIWDTAKFLENIRIQGHAYLGRKRILHQIPQWKSVKISVEEDFKYAELLIKANRDKSADCSEKHYWNG